MTIYDNKHDPKTPPLLGVNMTHRAQSDSMIGYEYEGSVQYQIRYLYQPILVAVLRTSQYEVD